MRSIELTQSFLSSAHAWVCDRYAIDTRFIARKCTSGWELIEASVALWPLPHMADASFTVTTPDIMAGQCQAFPVTKSEALEALRAAAAGSLKVNDLTLALPNLRDLDAYSEMTHRDRWFSPLHLRVSARHAMAPSPASITTLDAALRLGERPFDGTTDLAAWLGLNADFSGSRAPSITLTVAPPIDLIYDETGLSGDLLSATLHAHPDLNLDQVTLAVRAAPGGGLTGRRQVADLIVWSDLLENRRVGKLHVQLPSSDSVLTMLSLGTETVRRQWIIDPRKARNQRYIAMNQFDSDLRMIRNALFDAPDSRKFEQAVAVLLHIMGFSAAVPIETDSPDLIVSTPGGQTVIIECTLRVADFGSKSGKLVGRRALLAKALSGANLPGTVVAALVCRLRREEIGASDRELRERGILLLTAEDIESSLLRARFVLDPDALVKRAVAAMASAGQAA